MFCALHIGNAERASERDSILYELSRSFIYKYVYFTRRGRKIKFQKKKNIAWIMVHTQHTVVSARVRERDTQRASGGRRRRQKILQFS